MMEERGMQMLWFLTLFFDLLTSVTFPKVLVHFKTLEKILL
jgi:hypothetical protein